MSSWKKILLFLAVVVILICGSVGTFFVYQKQFDQIVQNPQVGVTDTNIEFISEVYDKIQEKFWEKISNADLSALFKSAVEKITSAPTIINPTSRNEVRTMVAQSIKDYDADKKREFVTKLADIVLANLKPFGRSRLYTTKLEQALKETVSNIDSSTDLYATLGIGKNATPDEVDTSYQEKIEELKSDKTPEAKEKLAQVNRAREAFSSPEKRKNYDANKTEPTVISKLITPDIFYLKLSKFSPQSFDEIQNEANRIDPEKSGPPTSLIFDLRGNIGGAIDILQYFLGPFIGFNQYAYDFFHQDEYTPFKTKVGWLKSLVRYKKVVILIDQATQSSAEVMAATLKKYHVGVLVGESTKGWGTVEELIPINQQIDATEKYSLLIVHSLTLREDGQPIESRGVTPDINISDKNWSQQLLSYFNYPPLAEAVKNLISAK